MKIVNHLLAYLNYPEGCLQVQKFTASNIYRLLSLFFLSYNSVILFALSLFFMLLGRIWAATDFWVLKNKFHLL